MIRFLSILLVSFTGMAYMAAADSNRPRLVLSIVVDQLRTDYLEFLQTNFSRDGFRKLIKDGVYMRNVDFGVSPLDVSSATAMIYTGEYPYRNGISASEIYDATSKKMRKVLDSPSTMGNFTTETFSPQALKLSTLSDELAIDGAGLGAIHSIAADPQQAIVMSGHAGNSAFWINDNTGKWSTTTYYPDVPQPVSQRNYNNSLDLRLDTMVWKPSLPIENYSGIPSIVSSYGFSYTFPRSDRDVFRRFISSPLANREITDMAIDYIRVLRLGTRGDAIDMLNIGYSVAPYPYAADTDRRLELQDTYLRLDSDLARLFMAVDEYVGLDNTLIFLCSTGYYTDTTADDPKYRIPTGEISKKRASSLLNAFLSAKYGNADYLDAFIGSQVYLNHKELENKGLDIAVVSKESRDFLCKMSGIADAYSMSDILGRSTPETDRLRLGIEASSAGDIYVEFMPGWVIVDDISYPIIKSPVRSDIAVTPAFLMAKGLKPLRIDSPINASSLAPTLSQTLRIRVPNGARTRATVF